MSPKPLQFHYLFQKRKNIIAIKQAHNYSTNEQGSLPSNQSHPILSLMD